MPGIDGDSVTVLKDAKSGKRVFFALVSKGSTEGHLVAKKSKVSPKKIDDAKRECGGGAVLQGRCHGEDGTLVFETARETAPTIATLTKKLLKEAGMTVPCDF